MEVVGSSSRTNVEVRSPPPMSANRTPASFLVRWTWLLAITGICSSDNLTKTLSCRVLVGLQSGVGSSGSSDLHCLRRHDNDIGEHVTALFTFRSSTIKYH